MLKQRIITAVVLAALFLWSVFGMPVIWFSLFVGVFVSIAAWEWANIAGLKSAAKVIYVVFIASVMVVIEWLLVGSGFSDLIKPILLAAGVWWAIALLWVQGYPSSAILWNRTWVECLVGFFVLLPAWLSMTVLRSEPNGAWLVILVVLSVAVADIGAYFFGRKFGRRKLAVEVSPGKSWEGVWGGFACAVIVATVVGYISSEPFWKAYAVMIPASLISVLGDLVESMFKRARGIKDSGTILPGHGGVLDRVDGITAAAPIFTLMLILTEWQL